MTPPPTDNIDRDPELIRTAINIIAKLDTNSFVETFHEFNEFTRNTAREFRGTPDPSPLVIAGVNINTATNTIESVSEPCSMESSPVKPHPDKPEHLIEYDVLAIVQATDFLDTPEHIQGALLQQLSSQWHIVTMLHEQSAANPLDQLNAFDELDKLLQELTNQPLEQPDVLNHQPDQSHLMDTHDQEDVNHLFAYQEGVECRYCNAFYTYDEFDQAIECCPQPDTDDADVLEEK